MALLGHHGPTSFCWGFQMDPRWPRGVDGTGMGHVLCLIFLDQRFGLGYRIMNMMINLNFSLISL